MSDKPLSEWTDDELAEAFQRGELVVTDVDDETRRRILTALDEVDPMNQPIFPEYLDRAGLEDRIIQIGESE